MFSRSFKTLFVAAILIAAVFAQEFDTLHDEEEDFGTLSEQEDLDFGTLSDQEYDFGTLSEQEDLDFGTLSEDFGTMGVENSYQNLISSGKNKVSVKQTGTSAAVSVEIGLRPNTILSKDERLLFSFTKGFPFTVVGKVSGTFLTSASNFKQTPTSFSTDDIVVNSWIPKSKQLTKILLSFRVQLNAGKTIKSTDIKNVQLFELGGKSNKIRAFDTCGIDKTIALTFNDGPKVNPRQVDLILDSLRSYGIKATFFVSPFAQKRQDTDLKCRMVAKYLREGHYVGCQGSTYDDFSLSGLDGDGVKNEIQPCRDWVKRCGFGFNVKQFRPFDGEIDRKQAEFINDKMGMEIVLWNVDLLDDDLDRNMWGSFQNMLKNFKSSDEEIAPGTWISGSNDDLKGGINYLPPSLIISISDMDEFGKRDPLDGRFFLKRLVDTYGKKYRFVTTQNCLSSCKGDRLAGDGICSDSDCMHWALGGFMK